MEIECSKCHKKFYASREDISVCPKCLGSEFTAPAPKLNEEEHAALVAEYKSSIKRQAARAESMGGIYSSGHAFDVAGTMRLLFGLAIFAVCALLFILSDKDGAVTFLVNEDIESQRLFSMIFCVVSAGLVATASVYYKKTVIVLAIIILVMGWTMPNMLEFAMEEAKKAEAELKAQHQSDAEIRIPGEDTTGPVLTDADLQVFYSLRSISNRVTHYAVFIDNQDRRARDIVRDALTRLLQAEYTRAHTRANGALYVVTNVSGARQNISHLLSRLGIVTYAAPSKGVYEVRFDADKANLVSKYSPDVLTSPMNPSYVMANLNEMKCLDPMRVRMSARSLANSNVQILRGEIRETLLQVLGDPWLTEPDTYSELIEALVVYSLPSDEAAAKHCFKYFEARRALKREVSPDVTRYLILQAPDAMVTPVVDMWCENPVAYGDLLKLLGYRVQLPLIHRLQETTDIRVAGGILKYLEAHGTREALPAVESFMEHPDSIIRHTARSAYNALQNR